MRLVTALIRPSLHFLQFHSFTICPYPTHRRRYCSFLAYLKSNASPCSLNDLIFPFCSFRTVQGHFSTSSPSLHSLHLRFNSIVCTYSVTWLCEFKIRNKDAVLSKIYHFFIMYKEYTFFSL